MARLGGPADVEVIFEQMPIYWKLIWWCNSSTFEHIISNGTLQDGIIQKATEMCRNPMEMSNEKNEH